VAVLGRLVEREVYPAHVSRSAAIRAAGGLWGAAHPAIRIQEVLADARVHGVRAMVVGELTSDLARELPDLEFLVLATTQPDVEHLARLQHLRSLDFEASWRGSLDLAWFPHLEWLSAGEPTDAQALGVLEGARRHGQLRVLGLGRYPSVDLAPLRDAGLRRLDIGGAPRLASLDGAGSLASSLRGLGLSSSPALPGLPGIEAFEDLESITLSGNRQVTSLDWVTALPRLRLLDVSEQKGIDSLAPLAGHPALEYVLVGPTRDLDLDPLATLPRLRLAWIGGARWNRDPRDFPLLGSPDEDAPDVRELRQLQHG
jgi:hypothetical protein